MVAKKGKSYPQAILELMAEKTEVLFKAQTLAAMGMKQTVTPLWLSAASYEERLAPLLEAMGSEREAALHRVSAASCYQKAGEPSRATNLFRAALAGDLTEETRRAVRKMLARCLSSLRKSATRKTPAKTTVGAT